MRSPAELAKFTIDLDRGVDATLLPELAPDLIQQVMLLNYNEKAPRRAKDLRIHPRTFNRYQSGESAPTLHRAVRLLDLLGYDVVIRKRHE